MRGGCQLIANSWIVVNEKVAIKYVDKSVLMYKSTGVPKEIDFFFEAESMEYGTKRQLKLILNKQVYEAIIDKQLRGSGRLRIRWYKDLDIEINNYFKRIAGDIKEGKEVQDCYTPLIEFIKVAKNRYEVILRYKGHIVR